MGSWNKNDLTQTMKDGHKKCQITSHNRKLKLKLKLEHTAIYDPVPLPVLATNYSSLGLSVSSRYCFGEIFLHCRFLFLIGENFNGTQTINDILRLTEVNFIEGISNFIFHILNHSSDVGNMRRRLTNGIVLFDLKIILLIKNLT